MVGGASVALDGSHQKEQSPGRRHKRPSEWNAITQGAGLALGRKHALRVKPASSAAPKLQDDTAFIDRMIADVAAAGVMDQPRFDGAAGQLVDGDLRIDLSNVWHGTRACRRADAKMLVDHCIRPKHLGHACHFGRVDIVKSIIDARGVLDGSDYGGDPVASAIEAWVVTPLHIRCIELLFDAGVAATTAQFDAFCTASLAPEVDVALQTMLVDRAARSLDPDVRARAKAWSRQPTATAGAQPHVAQQRELRMVAGCR